MEIYCTRPGCPRPVNFFADLDDSATLRTAQRKFCTTCGMPLILQERYIPSKLLGQGGFGAAFLARDRYVPRMRQCVVKQFQPSGDLTPAQLQIAQKLFEREAEVLDELGNQNDRIPELFAFFPITVPSLQGGKQDTFFYLVQEFIDGKTLEEELAEKGKFTENDILEIFRQILPVLKFVHESGSIHRDIKLSNIMRDRRERLYLLDFGAVKQATKAGAAGGQPGSSTGIYSMGFAPPEQMRGEQVYPSTDLYALAVTCLNLLTGKPPTELYDSYNNQWDWRRYADVSDRLADILDRMLLSAPNQRYESAEAVLHALTLPPIPVTQPPQPPPIPVTQPPTIPVTQPPQPPQPSIQVSPRIPPSVPLPKPRFSLVETLLGAAFTGFEGALLAIALLSLLSSPPISVGLLGMILGGLIYAQFRRIIEGKDLLIVSSITLAAVLFIAPLHKVIQLNPGNPLLYILFVAILAAAGAIAVTALFRLIYKLLSNFV